MDPIRSSSTAGARPVASPDTPQGSETSSAERASRPDTRGAGPAGIPGAAPRSAGANRARSTSSERADPDLQLLKRVGTFVRTRYGGQGEPGTEGLGSSNIVKLTSDDYARMKEADRLLTQGRAEGKPHGERGAQNCEELSALTLTVVKGARQDARFVEAGPHGIVALGLKDGDAPATARELGKHVKVSDPWAGVVARGDTYPDKLAGAMQDMADEGKRIRYNDPTVPADKPELAKKLELANDPNWQSLVLDSPMHVRQPD